MFYKYSLQDLQDKAEGFADSIEPPCSVLLSGNLGSGKTQFAKFFINKILIDKNQNITSPTFNIVQIYETTKGPLWHVDLYRCENEAEIEELGLLEAMCENICLIEWPDLIQKYIANFPVIEFIL